VRFPQAHPPRCGSVLPLTSAIWTVARMIGSVKSQSLLAMARNVSEDTQTGNPIVNVTASVTGLRRRLCRSEPRLLSLVDGGRGSWVVFSLVFTLTVRVVSLHVSRGRGDLRTRLPSRAARFRDCVLSPRTGYSWPALTRQLCGRYAWSGSWADTRSTGNVNCSTASGPTPTRSRPAAADRRPDPLCGSQ
jgi:hypothetical protein